MSLISLRCSVDVAPPVRVFLGASLQSLTLGLINCETSVINDAIVTIGQLPALTDLDLRLPAYFAKVNFAPLAGALRLQDFRCEGCVEGQLEHTQLDQLRELPHLRTMHVYCCRPSVLYFLRTPHSLQWQEIHEEITEIDGDLAAGLATLPTLTVLDTLKCRSVAFLPALTRLRTLNLWMDAAVRLAADIAVGLASCSQLTELTLEARDLTSQHLTQALRHLPLLHLLSLWRCSALVSLSFLSECGHHAQSLQSLELCMWKSDPPVAPSTELKHVLTLKGLTQLTIQNFFVDPLDTLMLDALSPPSVMLPKLKTFDDYKR